MSSQTDLYQPEYKAGSPKTIPAHAGIGEQVINTCYACGADVIMLSRTIQTFCYRCGVPLTTLGSSGLYYELITPDHDTQG